MLEDLTSPKLALPTHQVRPPSVFRDLAPLIHRQRLVIEGRPTAPIGRLEIEDYLSRLARVLDMHPLLAPVTHLSEKFGWAGWTHWETSGAHFYAWEKPVLFFSVDIYTCKPFDARLAIRFTKRYFRAMKIAAKSV